MLSFIFIKTINMALNGVRGLVLASLLGPQGYGVFGTLIVLQQYSSYLALGMREGVAIKLARTGDATQEREVIYSSALAWGACVGVLLLLVVFALRFQLSSFADYLGWVWLISLLGILNEILININRHEHKLRKVASVEFVYTAVSLLAIGILWTQMTIRLALIAMLAGLSIGVAWYLLTVRPISPRAVRPSAIGDLIKIGWLPAMFSAATIVSNSIFVPMANWMGLGEQVGLVVLANNLSVMLLFGLNTVAWALTSRSMQRLHLAAAKTPAVPSREDLGDILMRIGVVAAVLCALCSEILFSRVMTEYAGASVYVLYFCLFQSYALLLFSEANFLNVNSRIKPAIGGYVAMLVLIVGASLLMEDFLQLMQFAVIAYFLLALGITCYCRNHGLQVGDPAQRVAGLCFPAGCVAAHAALGSHGLIVLCAAVLALLVFLNRHRMTEYFATRAAR